MGKLKVFFVKAASKCKIHNWMQVTQFEEVKVASLSLLQKRKSSQGRIAICGTLKRLQWEIKGWKASMVESCDHRRLYVKAWLPSQGKDFHGRLGKLKVDSQDIAAESLFVAN